MYGKVYVRNVWFRRSYVNKVFIISFQGGLVSMLADLREASTMRRIFFLLLLGLVLNSVNGTQHNPWAKEHFIQNSPIVNDVHFMVDNWQVWLIPLGLLYNKILNVVRKCLFYNFVHNEMFQNNVQFILLHFPNGKAINTRFPNFSDRKSWPEILLVLEGSLLENQISGIQCFVNKLTFMYIFFE